MSAKRKKPISKRDPPYRYDSKHFLTVLHELLTGNDRVAAIVGAAFVEDALEQMLRARLNKSNSARDRLFGRESPLSSFSAKIDLCATLGIIGPQTTGDLHVVRDVRNKFAHRMLLPTDEDGGIDDLPSFKTHKIATWCKSLTLPTKVWGSEAAKEPKKRFTQTCIYVAVIMFNSLKPVGEQTTEPKGVNPILT